MITYYLIGAFLFLCYAVVTAGGDTKSNPALGASVILFCSAIWPVTILISIIAWFIDTRN